MLSYAIPASAIALSLATSAYALVDLPRLEHLAKEAAVLLPMITVALIDWGVPLVAAVSLLVACGTLLPIFFSARTATHIIAGALLAIPSLLLSALVFLAVFQPMRRIIDASTAG